MTIHFDDHVTIGDKYGPAMSITDLEGAREYFEACVEHTMRFGKTREEAKVIERANLGYVAGYYDEETRRRVERLFGAQHPLLGAVDETPSPGEILALGKRLRFPR